MKSRHSQRERISLLSGIGIMLLGISFYAYHTRSVVQGAPVDDAKEKASAPRKPKTPVAQANRVIGDEHYAVISERNLFAPLIERKRRVAQSGKTEETLAPMTIGALPPLVPPKGATVKSPPLPPPVPPSPPPEPPKPAALPLRMAGVIEDGERMAAFVEDTSTQRSRIVQVGDVILDAEVKQIEPTKIVLQKEGREIVLPLSKGAGSPLPRATAPQPVKQVPLEERVTPKKPPDDDPKEEDR